MRKLLLIALLTSLPSIMFAQRAAFGAPHFSGRPAWGSFRNGSMSAEGGFSRLGRFGRGSGAYLLPYLDPLYADYLYSTGYPVAAEPPIIMLQGPRAQPFAERTASPTQPLLIELRGNAYVQISGDVDPQARTIDATPASAIAPQSSSHEVELSRPTSPTPAVLIFRDGHQEEVSNYTIADGTLYASADYIRSGSWTRKIELSSLNLPQTVNSNQSRGVRFRLPQAPNEVILGP